MNKGPNYFTHNRCISCRTWYPGKDKLICDNPQCPAKHKLRVKARANTCRRKREAKRY